MKNLKLWVVILIVIAIIQGVLILSLQRKTVFLEEQVYKIGNWHCRLEEQYYADHLKGCEDDA
mgnify:CR=1 FL=1